MLLKNTVKDKVSVIIPTLNWEDFIERAIDSVLNQTYKNFEIIIVDDGSSDRTPDLLKKYANDSRIYVITNKTNAGQAAANNSALEKISGEYIAYLDCDDLMLKRRLELQVGAFKLDSNLGLVHSDIFHVLNDKGRLTKLPRRNYHNIHRKDISNALLLRNSIVRSTVMHKTECIMELGNFDTSISGNDDLDMWVRISEKFEVKKIRKDLIIKYKHSKMTSSTRADNLYSDKTIIHILQKSSRRRKSDVLVQFFLFSRKIRLYPLIVLNNENPQNLSLRLIRKFFSFVDYQIYRLNILNS